MGSLFSFISNPFEHVLGAMALIVGSAGIAIILFTIIIRLILAPLQIVQLRSARAMQKLQPQIAELRKKHGKDRQKLTEETMKLYKEYKVNPAMGCLPMLLQFPVLIGLFWALRDLGATPTAKATPKTLHSFPLCWPTGAVSGKLYNITPDCWNKIHGVVSSTGPASWLTKYYHTALFGSTHAQSVYNLFHAQFLWLSNGLGQPDPLYILPVLAGATQWIQSRMMMQQTSDPQQKSMQMLMNFTPLIIVFFALRYPSGLSLYWVTSTTIGILITMRITGWGSVPRVDRMVMARVAPSQALVSQKPKSGGSARPKSVPNGKADPTIGIMSDDESLNGSDSATENGDSTTTNVKQNGSGRAKQGRRRQGRPRGGRRG